MKQLEELEKRITQVFHKNKELRNRVEELKVENKKLQEQNNKLQVSLMNESKYASALSQEKNTIKNSIEDLLSSLHSLESTE